MGEKNNKIIKNIMSVGGIVFFAKILGFVKQMISANFFGATIQTDLISISEGFISNMDYLLVQALSTAFVPIYLKIKSDNEHETKKFVSDLIVLLFLLTASISIFIFALAPVISRVLAPTYSTELAFELARYIRIFSPIFIVVMEMALFNSLLKANETFVPGELISFNQSVIFIILVFSFGSVLGANTLVVAFICYAVFNLIFLMILSRRLWSLQFGNPFLNEHIKKMIKMMIPLLLGYSVVFVNQQVDKVIVSGLGEGIVTSMSYAAVLTNFITTFIGSLCTVLFTYIAQRIVDSEDKIAARLTMNSVIQMVTLLIPISVLTIINANDIVSIVFGRGKFDDVAVNNCALALAGYAIMFVPVVMKELFSRFQYAYGDSKTPMINSSISIVINIALSIILSIKIGVLGVTLASSISMGICAFLNYMSSLRKNKDLHIDGAFDVICRWIAGVCICMLVSICVNRVMNNNYVIIRFITISGLALLMYSIVAFPLIKPLVERIIKR